MDKDRKESCLECALPFVKTMEPNRREQFKAYFRTAPIWLIESFTVEEMDRDVIFIREGEPVDTIYLILRGIVKATDYRIYGIAYDFMHFRKMYAFGGMEIVMNLDRYRTTLETVTECTVLKIPGPRYQRWIKTDIEALKQEARLMGEYLLEQGRDSRAFLFLQGSDRLAMLFVKRYDAYAKDGVLRMKGDRQELSDATGLCVKTIDRALRKFRDAGLAVKEKGMIEVNQEQYIRLKEIVSNILEND